MNGLLLIDKPIGMTSHDVVAIVRKKLQTKKVGHTGTLDPMASGLLVLCVGSATKLVPYFTATKKTYEATLLLGFQTDTDDVTGATMHRDPEVNISFEQIQNEMHAMLGKQFQRPPAYSAIKIDGKKLVDLARKQKPLPSIPDRPIEIYEVELKRIRRKLGVGIFAETRFVVSKGTYIRAIARDLGLRLKTYGTLSQLKRTAVGSMLISEACALADVDEHCLKPALPRLSLPTLVVTSEVEEMIVHGRFLAPELFLEKTDTIVVNSNHEPLAIYKYDSERAVMRMAVMIQ